jgi:hypothetical protein
VGKTLNKKLSQIFGATRNGEMTVPRKYAGCSSKQVELSNPARTEECFSSHHPTISAFLVK